MTANIVAAVGSGGLVGFMLGLVGGGGSILATPLLLYVVGVTQPHIAIGTGALAVSVNAFANFTGHAVKGHVWWRCAIVFALVGAIGAFAGSSLGKAMDGTRLLLLFGVLVWRGARVARHSRDRFAFYAALGFTLMIGVQALINVSVALCLLPTKGMPLPLVSYGGSSLLTSMLAIGILLNLSQYSHQPN